jgi:hypothetical protein
MSANANHWIAYPRCGPPPPSAARGQRPARRRRAAPRLEPEHGRHQRPRHLVRQALWVEVRHGPQPPLGGSRGASAATQPSAARSGAQPARHLDRPGGGGASATGTSFQASGTQPRSTHRRRPSGRPRAGAASRRGSRARRRGSPAGAAPRPRARTRPRPPPAGRGARRAGSRRRRRPPPRPPAPVEPTGAAAHAARRPRCGGVLGVAPQLPEAELAEADDDRQRQAWPTSHFGGRSSDRGHGTGPSDEERAVERHRQEQERQVEHRVLVDRQRRLLVDRLAALRHQEEPRDPDRQHDVEHRAATR